MAASEKGVDPEPAGAAQARLVTVQLREAINGDAAEMTNRHVVEVVNASSRSVRNVLVKFSSTRGSITPVGLRLEDVDLDISPGRLAVDVVKAGETLALGAAAVSVSSANGEHRSSESVTVTWRAKPEPFVLTDEASEAASERLGRCTAAIVESLRPGAERRRYEWYVQQANLQAVGKFTVTDVTMEFTDADGRRWERTLDGTLLEKKGTRTPGER